MSLDYQNNNIVPHISSRMQFFANKNSYFVKCIKSTLRICRDNGKLNVIENTEFDNISDLECLGDIDAVIGKLQIEESVFLLVVTHSSKVATRIKTENEIRKIERISALPIDDEYQLDVSYFDGAHIQKFKKSQIIKVLSGYKSPVSQPKVVDEILRLFNDNGDFYYETFGGDITNSLQRSALSKGFDERFFWNKALLTDILEDEASMNHNEWIIPVVQGFVAQESLVIDDDDIASTTVTLTLISRRSCKRAGTRYLRRGIDDDGNVAIFVETELIIDVADHQLSFVQIRGSVPLYWNQKSYKFRPPVTLEKPLDKSYPVFEKHMNALLEEYGKPVICVNLVNLAGRELCLAQAFLEHILHMNSPDVSFISFDFHFHCRALKYDKVNDLVVALKHYLKNMEYFWRGKSGDVVLRQEGVIRTNCVECLDRTNVVQTALSQIVAESQFRRLGLITEALPDILTRTLQVMFADNGDAISRQYTGTDALKGDVARNGKRRLTGFLKDGYSSTTRYYMSHIRDYQRQLAIDTLIAGGLHEEAPPEENSDSDDTEDDSDNLALLNETVRFFLKEDEILVGIWAVVEGDTLDDVVDSILVLTQTHVYIILYEGEPDELATEISFSEITKIEIGKFKKSPRKHLKIYWDVNGKTKFGSWRAPKTVLFNNIRHPMKTDDEADNYVFAIADQLKDTISMFAEKEISINYMEKIK